MTPQKPLYVQDVLDHYVAEHTEQTGGPLSAGYSYLTLATKPGETADCAYGRDGKACPRLATLRHFDPEDGPVPSYFCLPHFLEYLDDVAQQAVKDAKEDGNTYTLFLSDDHKAGRLETIANEWATMWMEAQQ